MNAKSALARFLDQIRRPDPAELQQAFDRFRGRFAQDLQPRLQKFAQAHLKATSRSLPEFNLFRVLGLERDEAIHSRFLAELLAPNGAHKRGPLFLNLFLRHCEQLKGFPKLLESDIRASDPVFVKAEFSTAHGRPDIVLFSRLPEVALIIENKVDAQDEETQLERYWEILQTRFAFAGTRKALIYLTPDGRKPVGRIPDTVRYRRASYRSDIAGWIHSCAGQVSGTLKTLLSQYEEVVRRLYPHEEQEFDGRE